MKLALLNRERLLEVGQFLVDELDSMIARIRGGWKVEHRDDDTHGHVHAQSVATGRLTFSDIVTVDITQEQTNNLNPGGLSTASILRISNSTGDGVISITGITLPQDESNTIIDGRILVLENNTRDTYIDLEFENTSSEQYNRFSLPAATAAETMKLRIPPRALQMIMYDSVAARWMVHGQSADLMIATDSAGASTNNFHPTGWDVCGTLLVDRTAAGTVIGGIEPGSIPPHSRRRITNVGLYSFDILHAYASAEESDRVYCPGQIRYRVHPRETVDLYKQEDGGWRLVVSSKADQWVDIEYDSDNFTTDTGTWTVAEADQITYAYHLDGNKMVVGFTLNTTSIASNPTELRIAVPESRIIARTVTTPIVAINAGTQISTAFAQAQAGETHITIFRDTSSTAWSAATDTTRVQGEITFMVREDATDVDEPHADVAHGDTAHSDSAHLDVAHSDVAHGDSHTDTSHSDIPHSDVAHVDTTSHSDTHSDLSHLDTAHSDTVHTDSPESHTDENIHTDHGDFVHIDQSQHNDVFTPHGDIAHSDTAHSDRAHSDSHSDTSSHSDTAHSDTAHTDTGHGDSHSDTVPHSDVAHIDTAHGDTAHDDVIHQDVGFHFDTDHVDI